MYEQGRLKTTMAKNKMCTTMSGTYTLHLAVYFRAKQLPRLFLIGQKYLYSKNSMALYQLMHYINTQNERKLVPDPTKYIYHVISGHF